MIETVEAPTVFGDYQISELSPMLLQWHNIKTECPDALLLFRLGDFYEAFYQDAEALATACSLTLTKRQETPMSGVPQHTLDTYLDRLIQKGYRVAIAEQAEDPKTTKGIVKRILSRIESPATYAGLIEQKVVRKHFFASIYLLKNTYGLALVDLSTQYATVYEIDNSALLIDVLIQKQPKELLIDPRFEGKDPLLIEEIRRQCHPRITVAKEHYFHHDKAVRFLLTHFEVHQVDGLGLNGKIAAINATAALLSYLKDQQQNISSIRSLEMQTLTNHLLIDHRTDRHLNISSSLLQFLDTTTTAMGGRLFKEMVEKPLLEPEEIQERQEIIRSLITKPGSIVEINRLLKHVYDLERLLYRLSNAQTSTRELLLIHSSFKALLQLRTFFSPYKNEIAHNLVEDFPNIDPLFQLLDSHLEIPRDGLTTNALFKKGVFPQIDALHEFAEKGDLWLIEYQEKLRQEFEIKTLKVSFTRAFGYYIEVSRAQSQKLPDTFVRRQTLVQQERFITKELQAFEEKCLHAEETQKKLEEEALRRLIGQVLQQESLIKTVASKVAIIDSFLALSRVALKEGYVCPKVAKGAPLVIEEGRHPLIETLLPYKSFIPNSVTLDDHQKLALITGPNMGGKSTFMRQTALIILLAQIGSFVPAKSALLPPFDRLFSRIGAHDDLYRGQSTFMVEMSETAEILNNLTSRSFVLLDEIGRGTGTYDGISIAWAVLEHLATSSKNPKTLFATHYSELTECAESIDGVFNLKVLVKESAHGIHFTYKLVEGASDKSYGIHVAKLAGLPHQVVSRSAEILRNLERQRSQKPLQKGLSSKEQIVIF
ncbi:MAG: DNA mismatch repair protein MutS [Chlamydiia bacterium]